MFLLNKPKEGPRIQCVRRWIRGLLFVYNETAERRCGVIHTVSISHDADKKKEGINMKLIKKLRAMFMKDAQPVELDLAAANIREGRAILYPKGEKERAYLVKSNDIEVRMSQGKDLTDAEVIVLDRDQKKREQRENEVKKLKKQAGTGSGRRRAGNAENVPDRFKKRTFSVSLYPEEYDNLMATIQKYGYKRSDFILASAETATQGTMARAQKKVAKIRSEIRREEKAAKSQRVTAGDATTE